MIQFPSNLIPTPHHNTLPLIPLTLPNNQISPCRLHLAPPLARSRPLRSPPQRPTLLKHSNIWARRYKRITLHGPLTRTPISPLRIHLSRGVRTSSARLLARPQTKRPCVGSKTTSPVCYIRASPLHLAGANGRQRNRSPCPIIPGARNVSDARRHMRFRHRPLRPPPFFQWTRLSARTRSRHFIVQFQYRPSPRRTLASMHGK